MGTRGRAMLAAAAALLVMTCSGCGYLICRSMMNTHRQCVGAVSLDNAPDHKEDSPEKGGEH